MKPRQQKNELYKVGWYSNREKQWKHITVGGEQMLLVVAEKIQISDKVSVRRIKA